MDDGTRLLGLVLVPLYYFDINIVAQTAWNSWAKNQPSSSNLTNNNLSPYKLGLAPVCNNKHYIPLKKIPRCISVIENSTPPNRYTNNALICMKTNKEESLRVSSSASLQSSPAQDHECPWPSLVLTCGNGNPRSCSSGRICSHFHCCSCCSKHNKKCTSCQSRYAYRGQLCMEQKF